MAAKHSFFCVPFQRDTDLSVRGSRVAVTWIEWECGGGEHVCWRVNEGDRIVEERRLRITDGTPDRLHCCLAGSSHHSLEQFVPFREPRSSAVVLSDRRETTAGTSLRSEASAFARLRRDKPARHAAALQEGALSGEPPSSAVDDTRSGNGGGAVLSGSRDCGGGAPLHSDGELPVFEVFWVGANKGRARVFHAGSGQDVAVVEALSDCDCGEIAVACGGAGDVWLAVQVWRKGDMPGIELWQRSGGNWLRHVHAPCGGDFVGQPALAIAADGTAVLVWTAFAGGRSAVGGVLVAPNGAVTVLQPFAIQDHQVVHPAVAADGVGVFCLAACVERRIQLPGGDLGHHSRIVSAILEPSAASWHTEGESVIDYAMNPWMAGYAGRRRCPSLVGDPDEGFWVFFEEKLDPGSMSPGPGRLIMRRGGDSAEMIVDNGRSGYHVARQLCADGMLAVAGILQEQRYQASPPAYQIRPIDIAAPHPLRPADLPNNSDAPLFVDKKPRHDGQVGFSERPRDGEYQLYFGDPHLHSSLSADLEGDQEELYLFARDVAKLDFAAFTENDYVGFTHPLTDFAWERSKRNAAIFNEPGQFTTFVGWEYTLHAGPGSPGTRNSHRSVLFAGDDGPLFSWIDGDTPLPEDLVRRMQGQRVLLHHHHPSGYDITDDQLERNIEICSGWWNCMANNSFVSALHGLLAQGLQLGFIGGSDNHERNPGLGGALTGAWATENTREAIFAAFRARRVFATTGLRPDLRLTVAGARMGSSAETAIPPDVHVQVSCEAPIRSIEIIRDGAVAMQRLFKDTAVDLLWSDEECPRGKHYYYAHVVFEGETETLPWNRAPAFGIDAWTSPVWVRLAEV